MNVLTTLLDKLDDRLNPIVVKELRQAVKSRMVVGILGLFLGLQLFLLGFILMIREVRGETAMVDWNAGNEVFRIQQGILLWTIMILVPAYAAIRLAAERSDNNVDLMFISTLRPASIVWGKFFAALVLGLLVFSTCAPFMTFTYLLRGIDIPTILIVLGIDLLAMIFGIMLALFLSAIPGGRGVKAMFCFFGFIQLAWICSLLTAGTIAIIMEGGFIDFLAEYWYTSLVTVTGLLAINGLLYFYTVAMISPPSANRILPLRIYLLVVWLIMGVGLFTLAFNLPPGMAPIPVMFFLGTMIPLLSVQFLISICEREKWAPRVARTIPTNPLLRLPAFLLYTGAAGGILFTLALMVVSFVTSTTWIAAFSTGGTEWVALEGVLQAEFVVALYVFCYGLTAVLIRRHLLANQIAAAYTWIIAALLVGLGSSIPSVVAYVAFYEEMRRSTEPGWWALPNPFLALYEITYRFPRTRSDDFGFTLFWFLGTWAFLVGVLSMPWILAQLRRFQPNQSTTREPMEVIILEQQQAALGAG